MDRQALRGGDGLGAGADGEVWKQAIVVDTEKVRGHLNEMVRSTLEATLNPLPDWEADRVAGAGKYERSAGRRDTRAGSYQRKLQTKAGEVALTVPGLRKLPLKTGVNVRYGMHRTSRIPPRPLHETPAETPGSCVKTVGSRAQPATSANGPTDYPAGA